MNAFIFHPIFTFLSSLIAQTSNREFHPPSLPCKYLKKKEAMKLQLLSLSALLSSVVAAPSTVYFFSHGRPSTTVISNQETPQLNIQETRATLSHLLNLGHWSNNESPIDMNGPIQQVFNQPGMSRKDLFETLGGNLVMVVEGVKEAEGTAMSVWRKRQYISAKDQS